ncbi:MAG: hypothetical protein JJU32_01245 [Phormidium sp. BM_Day4_Bin.17]|nr:hypothetical protein [Phormidium sp. BM_Day4_Bin.17]UCJ12441.1 MAG: hypothetical protein JWS08_01015 [Phormidium sp. PBR-2020]
MQISQADQNLLRDLFFVLQKLNLPAMIVGAGAMQLVFYSKFGEGRKTKDWDMAVSLESWDDYSSLVRELTEGESAKFEKTQSEHKLIYRDTNTEVDLIPFGNIAEPEQDILWKESDRVMNVSGFSESFSQATLAKINDRDVKVVDIPGLVVLKMFAWDDRGMDVDKDLEDLDFILSRYEDDDRVYSELYEKLANEELNYIDSHVYLLGRDIANILQTQTFIKLEEVLSRMIEQVSWEEADALAQHLTVLQRGLRSLSSDNEVE